MAKRKKLKVKILNRAYKGVIKVYDLDIAKQRKRKQRFIDRLDKKARINRIGGLLKNVYSDAVTENQNLGAVIRRRFDDARTARLGGDHLEGGIHIYTPELTTGARIRRTVARWLRKLAKWIY